jgi:16S rRNA (guanine527-N7)-methyltransferase
VQIGFRDLNPVSRETALTMTDVIEQLRLLSGVWGIELEREQLSMLDRYADLLAGYELANVIGTRDREKIVFEHLLDALSCLVVGDLRRQSTVIDVGTGGGLPGIPLAIANSNLRVMLLETTERKVRFLKHALAQLNLPNLEVLHARAEDVGRKPEYRESFDLTTARALAALPVVVEYCAPLVRPGGVIIAMKGRLPEDELSQGIVASHELGAMLRGVREVEYPRQLPQKERRLVIFDKVDATPGRFPRRVGLAKKRPLGTRTGPGKPTKG